MAKEFPSYVAAHAMGDMADIAATVQVKQQLRLSLSLLGRSSVGVYYLHQPDTRHELDGDAPPVAAGESAILLHPPLPSAGVSIGMERGCQQNDSLAVGASPAPATFTHTHIMYTQSMCSSSRLRPRATTNIGSCSCFHAHNSTPPGIHGDDMLLAHGGGGRGVCMLLHRHHICKSS